jgi:hypothetical protein
MAKTLNALIYPHAPTVIAERRMIDVATIPAHKAAWWRPVEVVGNDAFDPTTHRRTGPVTTIEAARVLDTYTITALTAQEISDQKDAAVSSLNGGYGPLIKALLSLHNRVRVLEGQGTHTMAQFKTGLKALL